MNDLRSHLTELERTAPPDLWPDIETRRPRRRVPDPDLRRRLLAAFVALALAAGGLVIAVRAFTGERQVAPAQEVTGLARDIPLECTVRLLTPEVEPGGLVETEFEYRNIGTEPLPVHTGRARLLVRDKTGALVFDTNHAAYLTGEQSEVRAPVPLPPGRAVRWISGFHAIWGGSIDLRPRCEFSVVGPDRQTHASAPIVPGILGVRVRGGDQTPSRSDALDLALAQTGGLFDQCQPGADGTRVRGTISPPDGDPLAEPLDAACRAEVREEPGFAIVDFTAASPPSLLGNATTEETANRGLSLPPGESGEVLRWSFLVDGEGARPVAPSIAAALDPDFEMLGSLSLPPKRCAFQDVSLSCVTVSYVLRDGTWTRNVRRSSRAELILQPGIALFRPDPHEPVGQLEVLASGVAGGRNWILEAFRTVEGLGARVQFDGGRPSTSIFDLETVRGGCRVSGGGFFLDDRGAVWFRFGKVSPEVHRMVMVSGGDRAEATIYPLPGGGSSSYRVFVAILEGAAIEDYPEIEIYDASGARLDPGDC